MDLESLRLKFGIPGTVEFSAGQGGLTKVALTADAGSAEVYLHGAHVTRFVPKGGSDLLFISRQSHFASGKAIRGGVPLIFPWFGSNATNASLPAHGFVRNRPWDLTMIRKNEDGTVSAWLSLPQFSEQDAALPAVRAFPHRFSLELKVTVGKSLGLALEVVNLGDQSFTFEEALHTYLAVSDVSRVKIDGLSGRVFTDKVDAAARKTQPSGAFGITGETDRVYVDTPDTVIVNDPAGSPVGGPRVLAVTKQGSASTVVWNPWIVKAAAMPDFGDEEWPKMLCIETANVGVNAVTLKSGERHAMKATIGLA